MFAPMHLWCIETWNDTVANSSDAASGQTQYKTRGQLGGANPQRERGGRGRFILFFYFNIFLRAAGGPPGCRGPFQTVET